MIFLQVLLYISLFAFLVFITSVLIGVPCLPTHKKQAIKMVGLAGLEPGMKAVDLGSGAGRILFLAAKTGANVTGYELNPFLVFWTKLLVKMRGLTGKVDIRMKSLYDADLKDVDVVFAFLFPKPMKILGPKLFAELKPGARIVSYAFSIPGKLPVHQEEGLLVYKV